MTTLQAPGQEHVNAPVEEQVIGGVDTHKDTHHAAVIDSSGRLLGDEQFAATTTGHRRLLAWLRSFGIVDAVRG